MVQVMSGVVRDANLRLVFVIDSTADRVGLVARGVCQIEIVLQSV